MSYPLSGLKMDQIVTIAKTLFPKEAAKAEAWIMAEAQRQGLQYAAQKVEEAKTNPLVWAALGLGAVGLMIGLTRR